MLTAEVIGTGQTTGEVRPPRCKMGWNRAAGAGQGSRDGDYAPMEATVAPFCLPVRLDFGYSAVSRGRTCAANGKCRFILDPLWSLVLSQGGDGLGIGPPLIEFRLNAMGLHENAKRHFVILDRVPLAFDIGKQGELFLFGLNRPAP